MPLIKLWNADHTIKKVAQASSLEEVFLRDWTELEEEIFSELLSELPLNERVFVVAEIIPVAPPGPFLSGISELEAPAKASSTYVLSEPAIDTGCFPNSLQEALENQAPLLPRERRELVRRVADQLLLKQSRPRREEIRSAAAQVVAAYPLSLEDRKLDGGLLGRGYDSLFQQLENRVENLNRGKRSTSPAGPSSLGARRWAYGCANWQPVRRQIFDINPSKGSRCQGAKKSRTNVNTKVLRLAQKLRMIQ
ncbi:hypothetical protein HPB49_022660 [Dermacentor silvarum]|uniref:Uncharacterized protein n=1 Tax=Dermacentor silvarum TaxID=543639 RepID=A0ACB8CTE1_DERSI|nr:hypothetical protein HPB49_022660 [Dermacentor silvarum]